MASTSSSSSYSSSSSGEIQSPFALLEAVEAAIMAVCKMQSYKLGDRWVTYADLEALHKIRTTLKQEVAAAQGKSPAGARATFSGMF